MGRFLHGYCACKMEKEEPSTAVGTQAVSVAKRTLVPMAYECPCLLKPEVPSCRVAHLCFLLVQIVSFKLL